MQILIPIYPKVVCMAWRVHLTNQAIQNLHVLPGKPPALVAWTRRNRVSFYHLETGVLLGERSIAAPPAQPRSSDTWQEFAATLTGPDPAFFLPVVQLAGLTVHASDDGKLRLYQSDEASLYVETDGAEEQVVFRDVQKLIALDLDRALGTFAALDDRLRLHIFQQNIPVGVFEIGLQPDPDLRPAVAIARGGGSIVATDGRRIVAVTSSGAIQKTLETHYYVARLAISPSGGMVVTSDIESGVLRVYKGETLTLTHQRFAIDLVASANQLQLLADLPPAGTAISALTAYTRGMLAFAMSGVICVTEVQEMDEVPRPRMLL